MPRHTLTKNHHAATAAPSAAINQTRGFEPQSEHGSHGSGHSFSRVPVFAPQSKSAAGGDYSEQEAGSTVPSEAYGGDSAAFSSGFSDGLAGPLIQRAPLSWAMPDLIQRDPSPDAQTGTIQRKGPVGGTTTAPTRYSPPPEVPGTLPMDTQVVSLNTRPLYDAVMGAEWPEMTADDVGWNGWSQISVMCSQSFWASANLSNASTGGGVEQELAKEDVSFPGGVNTYRLKIRATIRNLVFQDADGVQISSSTTGGGTVGASGTVGTTNTVGGSVGVQVGDAKEGGQASGGLNASSAQSTSATGSSGLSGTAATGSAAEGVRFRFDVDWDVELLRDWSVGTGTAIMSLGLGYFSHLQVTPRQNLHATSTGGIIRFAKVRCIPAP